MCGDLVSQKMEPDRLGDLLSTHPVAGERYRNTGSVALAVAVGGGLLMTLLIAVPALATVKFLAYGLLATVGGLPIGAVQLGRALRSGRKETFELYENGFARRTCEGRQCWSWQQVAALRANPDAADGAPTTPIDTLARSLGWHFRCSIRLTDGARIRIDGYTADGPAIARTLLARCPTAVSTGNLRAWILLGASPLGLLTFGTPVVLLYRYLNATDAHQISAGLEIFFVIAMLTCLLGAALSLGAFAAALVMLKQDRDRKHPEAT